MNAITEQDVTADPLFLGEPPVRDDDENCSFCNRWCHYLDGGVLVTARDFHRFDVSSAGRGYYADELPACAR